MDTRAILDVARAAGRAAVAIHRAHLGRVSVEQWSEKGAADLVSHVDHEAERAIVDIIHDRFPGHAFLAEEGTRAAFDRGPERSEDALWVIDPLDGTTNYLHAYPMYAVSIAFLHRGRTEVGLVINGASGEEWHAIRGGGAFKDGRPIRVSERLRLSQALIGTGFPFRSLELLPAYLTQFDKVLRRVSGVRRAGSAAIDLCHVASGYFDGFWELVLAPWDVAAGALIIREAGGIVTTMAGEEDVVRPRTSILAGNPTIYAELARLLGVVRQAA